MFDYSTDKSIPFIVVYSKEDWRTWLEKNHLREKKVGMISYKKHTGKTFLNHNEAMCEAICFGWIDTTIKRLDSDRFIRYFVRRGDNANWSKNTLKYGKELFAAGKMSEHGILRYKQGLNKKPHDYGISDNPRMPSELKKELIKDKLLEKFKTLAPSTKKMFYRNLLKAKTKETQDRRIKEIISFILNK